MSPLLDADYSSIEARIVCWLSGQQDALDEYHAQDAATDKMEKERLDRYRIMAAYIFGIPIDEVQKFPHRFLGKECILGCGFGLSDYYGTFTANCEKKGKFKMAEGMGAKAVEMFREKHMHLVRYWPATEDAAKRAILNKGQIQYIDPLKTGNKKFYGTIPVFQKVAFLYDDVNGTPFLLLRLPSGRKLAYPRARLEGKKICFYGNIKGTQWGTVDTYGGKLVENITQAVAADIMANGAHRAEAQGYQIATLIHDQALAYYLPGNNEKQFVELLTSLPPWAKGLPITAEGGLVPFYKKD